MEKKILVTGATGNIGREIIELMNYPAAEQRGILKHS